VKFAFKAQKFSFYHQQVARKTDINQQMSSKEFFSFSSLRPIVIEFLKTRADFSSLDAKFKKPFRAYINKH